MLATTLKVDAWFEFSNGKESLQVRQCKCVRYLKQMILELWGKWKVRNGIAVGECGMVSDRRCTYMAQVLAGTFSRSTISPTAAEIAADMEMEAALAEESRSNRTPIQQQKP